MGASWHPPAQPHYRYRHGPFSDRVVTIAVSVLVVLAWLTVMVGAARGMADDSPYVPNEVEEIAP